MNSETMRGKGGAEPDWKTIHPWYGPCDGFGPGESCSACTGVLERIDGAWIDSGTGELVKARPWFIRIKAAWAELWFRG